MSAIAWNLVLLAGAASAGAGAAAAAGAGETLGGASGPDLRRVASSSLILLLLALAIGILSLGHPSMALTILSNPGSGLFWELFAFGASILLSAAYVAALSKGAAESTCRTAGTLSGSFALLLMLFIGLTSYMPWSPVWGTWTLAVPFVLFAVQGAVFVRIGTVDAGPRTRKFASIAPAVTLASIAIYLSVLAGSSDETAAAALSEGISGSFAAGFWGLVVIAGIAVPALLPFLRNISPKIAGLAGLLLSALGCGAFQWFLGALGTVEAVPVY